MIPLSLYIHFPWCIKKCPYCDFNSHNSPEALPEKRYVEALLEDIEQELPFIGNRCIKSIFMGGGTPSLFSSAILNHLLKELRARLLFSPDIEITLEANPGTVEQQKFQSYREIGINRLSLGVQSFQAEKLKVLGRIHNGQEAKTAIGHAKQAGFENFNIDLMFGLPNQTLNEALLDLQTALSFQPPHLSWYQLTIEPHTHFFQFPPRGLPEEETIWEMQISGQNLLLSANYLQYEISAYSLNNFQCQHNRNYWEFGDYLGIGAGAHSKITHPETGAICRKWKTKHPKQYLISEKKTAGEKMIPNEERPLEFFLNAFRLFGSIPISLFEERTRLEINSIAKKIDQAINRGLIVKQGEALMTTDLGKRFLNDLLQIFTF
jgi:putative oxygen-independent coproporphyrinogen III oxidase